MRTYSEHNRRTSCVRPPAYEFGGQDFESLRARQLRYKAGNAKTRRFYALDGDECTQQYAFGTFDANFLRVDFDALCKRTEVIPAVAAAVGAHAPAGLPGEAERNNMRKALLAVAGAVLMGTVLVAPAYSEVGHALSVSAIADFSEAIRPDPRDAIAYGNRGMAYYANGDLDRAIADFDKAIRPDPKDAIAYNNRGAATRRSGGRTR
jgi:tetratricopeptide (TPR) repeat protein